MTVVPEKAAARWSTPEDVPLLFEGLRQRFSGDPEKFLAGSETGE